LGEGRSDFSPNFGVRPNGNGYAALNRARQAVSGPAPLAFPHQTPGIDKVLEPVLQSAARQAGLQRSGDLPQGGATGPAADNVFYFFKPLFWNKLCHRTTLNCA
jgi:hypothetical protein